MGRLQEIRTCVDRELSTLDADRRKSATVHLYGVSLAAGLLARKRGLSAELAQIAALMHDLSAYTSGSYEDHANRSAEIAQALLTELGLTTEDETNAICKAIRNHDDKHRVDAPLDEVLKDADVVQHTMQDFEKTVKEKEKARFEALCAELDFRP